MEAIIAGLSDGTIDAIASMHMPQSPSSKDLVFEQAAPGMISFETVLPLSLALVRDERISLERMVYLLSTGPAKVLGLDQKGLGSLKVGSAAVLVAALWLPELARPAAGLIVVLMLGALAMHLRVGDPAAKSAPAFAMLVMSGALVALH